MNSIKLLCCLITTALIAGCSANNQPFAENQAPESYRQGEYSNAHMYSLPNGLDVILWPNSNTHSHNEASLNLIIHSGSLHEEDQQLGYAHFVEHMLFNQQDNQGANPVNRSLADLGLSIGQHANAYTTFDHTRYFLDVPNATEKRIEQSINLLSQFAYQSKFLFKETNKEIGVVREEWRRSQPQNQNYNYQRTLLNYTDSRYIDRLPIGNLSSIVAATPEALNKYYTDHYRPSNATLIVTGDFDISEITQFIAAKFGPWQSQVQGRAQQYAKPSMRKSGFDSLRDSDQSAYHIWIGNAHPLPDLSTSMGDFQYSKIFMVTDLIEERLKQLITQQKNSLRDLHAGVYTNEGDYVDVGIGVLAQQQDIETGTKLMASVINNIVEQGFSQHELDNLRNRMLENERSQQDSAAHLAKVATENAVNNYWLRDQAHFLNNWEQHLPTLTTQDLNELAKTLFAQPHNIEIVSKPRVQLPSQSQFRQWLQEGSQQPLIGLQDQTKVGDIEWQIKPPAGHISSEEKLNNGLHTYTLSNGVRVRYQYSDSAPGKFYMHMLSKGGYNALNPQQVVNARLATAIMAASGLQSLDGNQLRNWIESQALTLQPEFTLDARGLRLDGPTPKAESLFQLLHVALQDARIDPDIWDYYMPVFEQELKDLHALGYYDYIKQAEAIFSGGSPARRSLTIDEIHAVTPETMMQAYRQFIAGAQHYVLNITGDIQPHQFLPYLENYIANLPVSSEAPLIAVSAPRWPNDHNLKIIANGNVSKASEVGYYLQIDASYGSTNNPAAYRLLSRLITGELNHQLREELGLTYSVSANVHDTLASDTVRTLGINLQCDPEQVDTALKHINGLLDDLSENGFGQGWVDQRIASQRSDFNNESHKAKTIMWRLIEAEILAADLNDINDARAIIPDTDAEQLRQLLGAFVTQHHSKVITVLNP